MCSWVLVMTRMTPAEAFAETLVAHGVKRMYGIAGSAFMEALDLFPTAGVRFISTQHEQAAVWMAEADARISAVHSVGMCIAQNGPGVANLVNALQGAYWNHVPLVAFTPDHSVLQTGLGGFQETDQLQLLRAVVKRQFQVRHPSRMADVVAEAVKAARECRAPVQVNIPRDMWQGEFDFPSIRARSPLVTPLPHPHDMERVRDLLGRAKRPVLIVGGGVVQGRATSEAVAVAEKLEIPVATTYLHSDAFPSSHRLALGPVGYNGSKAAMQTVAETDLLLCVGTRINPYMKNPQYGLHWWPGPGRGAKIVQADLDASRIGLTCPVDLGICSDARNFLLSLLHQPPVARDPEIVADHLSTVALTKAAWTTELDKMSETAQSGNGKMAARRVFRAMEAALKGRDPVICLDTGNLAALSAAYLNFFEARTPGLLGCGMWASCGPAVSYAIGAAFALQESASASRHRRPIVAVTGEGAFLMAGVNEIVTAVREQIGIIVVILVNDMWGAEAVNQQWFFNNRTVGTRFSFNPNFAELATTLGAHGFRCTSEESFTEALKQALELSAQRKTCVLEVLCTEQLGEPFRRDAMKTPRPLLDKYKRD